MADLRHGGMELGGRELDRHDPTLPRARRSNGAAKQSVDYGRVGTRPPCADASPSPPSPSPSPPRWPSALTAQSHADAGTPARKAQRGKGWTEADKTGFGTATDRKSRVWFTLQGGRVSEVFYPDLSTPSVRTLELHGDRRRPRGQPDPRHDHRRHEAGRAQPAVHPGQHRQRGPLPAHRGGRHRPGPQRGRHPRERRVAGRRHSTRSASATSPRWATAPRATRSAAPSARSRRSTTKARVASTLVSSPGLFGTSDEATAAIIRRAASATISLGFGRTPQSSSRVAKQALAQPWTTTARRTTPAGTTTWPRSSRCRPARQRSSASTSPRRSSWPPARTRPTRARSSPARRCPGSGATRSRTSAARPSAYHEVWSRDLYQIGTALYAMGDVAAAQRAVRWLFPPSRRRTARSRRTPTSTAPRSGPRSSSTRSPCRSRSRTWSARPTSAPTGASRRPSLPHAVPRRGDAQAGAVLAAGALGEPVRLLAGHHRRPDRRPGHRRGDRSPARRRQARQEWERMADRWARKVKDWTVTTNGPLSDAPYFLRVTKDGKPNKGTTYAIGDGGPARADQRRVVDASFLDLVRFGILSPTDPDVVNSLEVVDQDLAVADAQRHVLAPLLLRRVRRDAHRRPVGRQRRRRARDPRARLAAARRRARRVRRRGRPERSAVPGQHGRRGQRLGHARRAGLGRPRPDRQRRAARRVRAPARRRRCCGRTRCWSGSRGRSRPAIRWTSSRWWPTATWLGVQIDLSRSRPAVVGGPRRGRSCPSRP